MQIELQLEAARERLLDLTLRNRLLNFRSSKRRSIQIVDEIPREIYDTLVLNERLMDFRYSENQDAISYSNAESDGYVQKTVDTSILQNYPDTVINNNHTDRFLQTVLSQEELQKRLYYINQQSRTVFEEQGYSVLYLALGFLRWHDDENREKMNKAPLILIPVELERQNDRTKYKIRWNGSDILPNLSLEAKLSEYGVSLPTTEIFDEKDHIDTFFHEVIDAISSKNNWEVVNEIYLDLFSFTKFVMYQDLDPKMWDINNHRLLELVLSGSENELITQDLKNYGENLELPSESVYQVMDADSSQIAVIEEVKTGKNLVVEGPPGTGKSQTITNMIAELLAHGKKVLFVSEKMAALEVVKSRLDKVGLGNYCLELHSHKSNKKEVLHELERSLNTRSNHTVVGSDKYTQLDSMKDVLNGYVKTLHTPIANTEKSPSELFYIREKWRDYLSKNELNMPQVWFPNPSSSDLDSWNNTINRLEDLSSMLHRVIPISDHPWRGCAFDSISLQNEEEIFQVISDFALSLDNLLEVFSYIEHKLGIRIPKNFEYYEKHSEAMEVIVNAFSVDSAVLLNTKWDSFNDEAKELIQQVEIIAQAKEKFTRYALDIDPILKLDTSYIMKLADEYEDYSYQPKWKRMISWNYIRNVKNPIRSYYRLTMPKDPVIVRSDLKELSECITMREQMEWIMAATETGPSLFGNQWDGEDSLPERLKEFADWIVRFRGYLRDGTFTEKAVDIVSKGTFDANLETIKNDLDSAVEDFKIKRNSLFESLNTNSNKLFGIVEKKVFFSRI